MQIKKLEKMGDDKDSYIQSLKKQLADSQAFIEKLKSERRPPRPKGPAFLDMGGGSSDDGGGDYYQDNYYGTETKTTAIGEDRPRLAQRKYKPRREEFQVCIKNLNRDTTEQGL